MFLCQPWTFCLREYPTQRLIYLPLHLAHALSSTTSVDACTNPWSDLPCNKILTKDSQLSFPSINVPFVNHVVTINESILSSEYHLFRLTWWQDCHDLHKQSILTVEHHGDNVISFLFYHSLTRLPWPPSILILKHHGDDIAYDHKNIEENKEV